MSGMSLYKMTGSFQRMLDDITDCVDDGIQFEALTESLDSLEGDIRQKVENCAKMVRCLDARAKTFKEEQKFFEAKSKAAANAAERLEDYIKLCMETVGMDKVEGDVLTVKIQKNSKPSLVVDGKVPERFLVPQEPKANNAAITEALLAKEELDFARLNYGKHIRIS